MISRRATRLALNKAILALSEKQRKEIENWKIADFRHSVFETVTVCKTAKRCSYFIDVKLQRLIFKLFFNTKSFDCIFFLNKKNDMNVMIRKYNNTTKQQEEVYFTSVKEMPNYMKELQPKVVVKVKTENENKFNNSNRNYNSDRKNYNKENSYGNKRGFKKENRNRYSKTTSSYRP